MKPNEKLKLLHEYHFDMIDLNAPQIKIDQLELITPIYYYIRSIRDSI